MKTKLALIGALMLWITGCSGNAADRPEMALIGKKAPDFKLALLDGGEVELSKLQDKNIVLLDFWATWCGPCRQVMPALSEISKEYKPKGVRYLAVNLREDPAKIQSFLKSAGLKIEVPLDKDGSVAKLYKVRGIPTMAIVDKKGVVRDVHVGSSPKLKTELKKTLDKILAE
jgi:thiol-disulfide isomerase/thioredoxin